MTHIAYPKWLYHRSEKPVLVGNKDEHDALGAGWEATPTAFDVPEAPAVPEVLKKRGRKEA